MPDAQPNAENSVTGGPPATGAFITVSLFPFVTAWMGENHYAPLPTAIYGAVLLLAGTSYTVLQATIIACDGLDAPLAKALGSNLKGKVSLATTTVARRSTCSWA